MVPVAVGCISTPGTRTRPLWCGSGGRRRAALSHHDWTPTTAARWCPGPVTSGQGQADQRRDRGDDRGAGTGVRRGGRDRHRREHGDDHPSGSACTYRPGKQISGVIRCSNSRVPVACSDHTGEHRHRTRHHGAYDEIIDNESRVPRAFQSTNRRSWADCKDQRRCQVGMTRKTLSMCTLGLIDYRSDKERVARSARLTKQSVKEQTKLMRQQAKAGRRSPE